MTTVVDLKKVSYTQFWWEDGEGNKRNKQPKGPTLHGRDLNPDDRLFPQPGETQGPLVVDVARERNALGVWCAKIKLQFSSTHALVFSGERAVKLKDAWNARIFGGQRG